jgi:hypothetical protein
MCACTTRCRHRLRDQLREAGVEPIEPYKNSSAPWRCRCQACGREVAPRLTNVRSGHAACSYCVRHAVDPDAAVAVMRAAHLEPAGPYPGATKPWPCRCAACGRESTQRYANVYMGTGCRYCGVDRIVSVCGLGTCLTGKHQPTAHKRATRATRSESRKLTETHDIEDCASRTAHGGTGGNRNCQAEPGTKARWKRGIARSARSVRLSEASAGRHQARRPPKLISLPSASR